MRTNPIKFHCILLLALFIFVLPKNFFASVSHVSSQQQGQPTADELIGAVNALRLAHGLAPLRVNSILMQTAQNQANALLATEGAIGHGRPNGITFTQQLLMLGYPLSGDLSLGGYRSENFVFGTGLTVQEAIQFWLGDEPHTNTMISPNRNDIGGGVTIASDGTVYYVIDTALHTNSGLPQSEASSFIDSTQTADPQAGLISQYIVPVSISTARPDGDVFHNVQYGQSLWSIAIEYHTKINQLRALNHLGEGTIVYPGQILLVQKGATQPSPATATPIVVLSLTSTVTSTSVSDSAAFPTLSIPTMQMAPVSESHGPSFGLVMGLLVLVVMVIVVIAAWLIREPN